MSALNKIVMAAIMLLVGIILIGAVAPEQQKKVSLSEADQETIDISNARNTADSINATYAFNLSNAYTGSVAWKAEETECNIQVQGFGNGTSNFTETTDFTVSDSGIVNLVNSTAMLANAGNTTYMDYRYCADDYTTLDWGRSVLNIMMGLCAFLMLGGAVAVLFSVYKDMRR